MGVKMNIAWHDLLMYEKEQAYFQQAVDFVVSERKKGKAIFPPKEDTFNAFKYCPLDALKVVILGQDPYHNINQAHGLAFSVHKKAPLPPSLINIYKELNHDLGIKIPQHGCLIDWAKEGVLLLNTVLTVEAHKARSHANVGWEQFTSAVIQKISDTKERVVFMLWGSYAQKKDSLINQKKHLILRATHPSPLSAHRGFFGCHHFSKANQYLKQNGLSEIDWRCNN